MASNGKTVSLGSILWKVIKRPLVKDLNIEDAAESAIDFLEKVGAPLAYVAKSSLIKIENKRGILPDDLLYVEGVRYKLNECDEQSITMRGASDSFHITNSCKIHTEFTYILQSNHIFTTFEEGYVEISYKAIELDNDGYPLIPDNIYIKNGLIYYIIFDYIDGLHDIGKISDKIHNKYFQRQDYYLSAASASLKMPSIDKMETITNALTRIVSLANAHSTSFRNFGIKEQIKKYN